MILQLDWLFIRSMWFICKKKNKIQVNTHWSLVSFFPWRWKKTTLINFKLLFAWFCWVFFWLCFALFYSAIYLFIYLFWEVWQKIRNYHFKERIFCMIVAKQQQEKKNPSNWIFWFIFMHFSLHYFQYLFLWNRINEHETTHSSEILIVIAIFYRMFHQLRKTSTVYEFTLRFWNRIDLLTFPSLKMSSRKSVLPKV